MSNRRNNSQDIFDKIMHLPVLRIFEPFYKRHKEVLLYLFFGFLTFLISILSYAFFSRTVGLHELIANVLSWILAVIFAFLTNRKWVFDAETDEKGSMIKQVVSFGIGRLFTLGVEEGIILIFVTWLGLNEIGVKVVAQIVVIVLNYIISKWVVFRK